VQYLLAYCYGVNLNIAKAISPKLRIVIWGVMLCSWLAQALAARDLATADAVSYLDISYSCLGGNWHALINGWWSPGYPFLLAIWLKLFKPSPFDEAVVMHMLAFATLIVALLSFDYFMSVFLTFRKKLAEEYAEDIRESLPDAAIWLVGYSLFFWISTFLTPPSLEQPDILVFILYLLASALCMQLVSYRQQWSRYVLLGIVLGLGYLVKAVMFPLAFVFYLTLICQKDRFRSLPRLVISVAIFAAVSMPFCLVLSQSKGRFTFGDVGVMAYRHVMGMDEEPLPAPAKPKPAAAPHIGEFTQIIKLGTYPPWADPSHGYRATPFHFNFWRQLNRTHVVLRYYFELYIVQLGALISGFLVLLFSGSVRQFGKRLLRHVVLWLPAVTGLAFYASMRVDGRFLAGYTIALFAACAASMRMADSLNIQKLMRPIAFAVSFLLLSQVAVQVGHEGLKLFGRQKHSDWEVATTLHEMGVKDGDRVSYMGYALIDHAWAHLARVKIAAEIPQEDVLNFWAAEQAERVEATKWLAFTAAKVLVTRGVPNSAMAMGWRKVGDTDYYVLALPEENIHSAFAPLYLQPGVPPEEEPNQGAIY